MKNCSDDLPTRSRGPSRAAAGQNPPGPDADRRYLVAALCVLAAFVIAEVVVAVAARSLALLSDAGHMLADIGAIAAALWAIRLAARPPSGAWTFGWKRAEILSAAVNGITLVVLVGILTVQAITRLIHPPDVDAVPVLVVALAGMAVNVVAARLLAGADRSSLNVAGAFRHVLTDLYGFVGTALAAVIIIVTGFTRADPIAALLVVCLMARAAWALLRASGRILLEAAPEHIDLDNVRAHLLGTSHVRGVHDLHAWTVTSSLPALSAHVIVDDSCFTDGAIPRLLDELQACLAGHFDVEHSTFQLEASAHAGHEPGTH
ncbi:MAG: cation transporter [Actinobacteria bacterium]|nr:cation transporter [Actinomycetota bacterium]MBO0832298.1 cation transporter [Actinomycetota bacterium]MBO0838547.1 cation transporter [Actinomycetota bacterium]